MSEQDVEKAAYEANVTPADIQRALLLAPKAIEHSAAAKVFMLLEKSLWRLWDAQAATNVTPDEARAGK